MNSPLEGSVELNLKDGETVKSVSVTFIGELLTSGNDRTTFLNISQEIFSASTTDISNVNDNGPSKYIKLVGSHSFPYTLSVPSKVILKNKKGDTAEYDLPQTYFERLVRVTINYRIFATVKRGKFKADSQVGTNVVYTPVIKPTIPSPLRQLAYAEEHPLIGPDGDPEGWHSLEPVTIRGTIFNSRNVEAICTLSLAKPLSYTRGSFIPLHLSIQCSDMQALNLLSTPRSIDIKLRRILSMTADSHGLHPAFTVDSVDYQNMASDIETAAWWPSAFGAEDNGDLVNYNGTSRRMLDGEIRLPVGLYPSSQLLSFAISYVVIFYPMTAVAFSPEKTQNKTITSEAVNIVTAFLPGPRPKSYAPPSYERTEDRIGSEFSNMENMM
ncbi:hypothetical protein ABKN59_006124 [Abortiporus biennis]